MIFDALLKYKQLYNAVNTARPNTMRCFDDAEGKTISVSLLADVATCVSYEVGLDKEFVRGNIEEIDILIDYVRNLPPLKQEE